MSVRVNLPDLFLSLPHPCSYLPDREASTLFVDPRARLEPEGFALLMQRGFRRSGDLVYRPHCADCRQCVPLRVEATGFRPNRAQRRTWRRNQDLAASTRPAAVSDEHFDLYLRYQRDRHPGGGMDDPDPARYREFVLGAGADTRLVEFRTRADRRLMCVAVLDCLPDGLSAVYTYYDPDARTRSLGTYAVLWQLEYLRARGLPWLYLGYWIKESSKMAYKTCFRPAQAYTHGRWRWLTR